MIGRSFVVVTAGLCVMLCLTPNRVSAQQEKCQLPLTEGNCSESIQRWYYNNRTGACQQFVYRGCNGNANNFNSSEYCYHACNGSSAADATGGEHSYSITDVSRRIKANNRASQQPSAPTPGSDYSEDEAPANPRPASGDVILPTNPDESRRPGGQPAPSPNNPGPVGGAPGQPGNAGPRGAVAPTSVPALIQNRNPAGQQQPGSQSASQPASKPKHTSGSAATPSGTSTDAATSTPKPSRTKRSTSSKSDRRRSHDENDEEVNEDDEGVESKTEDEESSTKKSSSKQRTKQSTHKKVGDDEVDKKQKEKTSEDENKETVQELVERMQKTALKLEKLANKKSKKSSADNEEPEDNETESKNEENHTKVEKSEKPEPETEKRKSSSGSKRRTVRRKGRLAARSSVARSGKRSSEKTSSKRKSSESGSRKKLPRGARSKLLDVTLVGGTKSAVGDRAVRIVKQSSTLGALLKLGLEEGRRAAAREQNNDDDDDEDDDDIEIVGERIRTIILDPTYVFSYSNISAEDMISLQEMAAQSEIATMQLIEKMADDVTNKTAKNATAVAAATEAEAKPTKSDAPIQTVNELEQQTKESLPKETELSSASVAGAVNGGKSDQNTIEGSTDKVSAE